MKNDCFFTACSTESVLNLHFFNLNEDEKLSLNIKLDFSNEHHSFEYESLGLWLSRNELKKFMTVLNGSFLKASLKDLDGNSVFDIIKNNDGLVFIQSVNQNDSSISELFSIRLIVDNNFREELIKGLESAVQCT